MIMSCYGSRRWLFISYILNYISISKAIFDVNMQSANMLSCKHISDVHIFFYQIKSKKKKKEPATKFLN